MHSQVINLITLVQEKNDTDELVNIVTKKEVFADKRSIWMKETYEAHMAGFKPSIAFVLADFYDYADEPYVEFENKLYKVIRTYQKSEDIQLEIVCEHLVNKSEVYGNANA